ncbi:hypothetical protein C8R46DRAFT_1228747 [Mycena filopes]|nr:hypothetical protein C8R46DRAFT_1228637 [Mycena filopes]KAJ7152528.1 hypothetical protein C8R46DRAFT_1228747 [Mycena filopes]
MAAAQNVFRSVPTSADSGGSDFPALHLSHPRARPRSVCLERFWGKITSVSTRYHDGDNNWTGCVEIRTWNNANRGACDRCTNSKTNRLFLFDMTKDEYFSSYDEFMRVYQIRDEARKRGIKKARSTTVRLQRHRRTANAAKGRNSPPAEEPYPAHFSYPTDSELSASYPDHERSEEDSGGNEDGAFMVNTLISMVVMKLQPLIAGLRAPDDGQPSDSDVAQLIRH